MTRKSWRLQGAALQAGSRLLEISAERTKEMEAVREEAEARIEALGRKYEPQVEALQKEIAELAGVPEEDVPNLAIDASYFEEHGEIYLVQHDAPGKMTLADILSAMSHDGDEETTGGALH